MNTNLYSQRLKPMNQGTQGYCLLKTQGFIKSDET
jgi:hypothetical protein